MAELGFINKMTASDYQLSTKGSHASVTLESDTRKLRYDGYNVVVPYPKVGDIVYVPTSCVYSAATPGSGVTEGAAIFIAGETVNNAAMNTAGYTAVGPVVSVRGRKATVLFGSSTSNKPFFKTATSSAYTLDESIFTADEWSKITVGNTIDDMEKRNGYRQCVSFPTLKAYLTKTGGENGTTGWSGGSNSDGDANTFYSPYDWGLNYDNPDTSVDHSAVYASNIAEYKAKYGSDEAGWTKYILSRMPKYPSANDANIKFIENAKAATDLYVGYNESEGIETDFFPHAQWARNHHETYGSYGNFFNVEGLRRDDWFEPSMTQIVDIFKNVTYGLKNKTYSSDPINLALHNIGRDSNAVKLAVHSYWVPVLRSRSNGWYLHNYGYFYYNTLNGNARALSVALLEF